MNLALVHDRRLVQSFWEEKISSRTRNEEDEEQRLERSALARLRAEWLSRLEVRNQHVKSLDRQPVKSRTRTGSAEQESSSCSAEQ